MMVDEGKKAHRFEEGLRADIYDCVFMFEINNFQALMEKAIVIEGPINTTASSTGNFEAFVP